MRTVRCSELPERDREVEGDGRLADAALRARRRDRTRVLRRLRVRLEVLADAGRSGSSGRSRRTASTGRRGCPVRGSGSIGFCGTVRTMTGHAELGLVDLLDELGPLTRPWSSASTSTTSGRSSLIVAERLAALGQDVEELDRCLRVQQAADVLGDLRDVLDDQQARLVTRCHRPTIPRGSVERTPPGGPARRVAPAVRQAAITA